MPPFCLHTVVLPAEQPARHVAEERAGCAAAAIVAPTTALMRTMHRLVVFWFVGGSNVGRDDLG
jgi:hypothetical protein